MCYDDINECVMTIEMDKPLDNYEQIFGNSWAIWTMVAPVFLV